MKKETWKVFWLTFPQDQNQFLCLFITISSFILWFPLFFSNWTISVFTKTPNSENCDLPLFTNANVVYWSKIPLTHLAERLKNFVVISKVSLFLTVLYISYVNAMKRPVEERNTVVQSSIDDAQPIIELTEYIFHVNFFLRKTVSSFQFLVLFS